MLAAGEELHGVAWTKHRGTLVRPGRTAARPSSSRRSLSPRPHPVARVDYQIEECSEEGMRSNCRIGLVVEPPESTPDSRPLRRPAAPTFFTSPHPAVRRDQPHPARRRGQPRASMAWPWRGHWRHPITRLGDERAPPAHPRGTGGFPRRILARAWHHGVLSCGILFWVGGNSTTTTPHRHLHLSRTSAHRRPHQ
jgi:hypothetical protein